MLERNAFFSLFSILVLALLVPVNIPKITLPVSTFGFVEERFEGGSLLFVGDIMMGRHVETLAEKYGNRYPVKQIVGLVSHADVSVGNFEAVVLEKHIQTPDLTFNLAAKEETLSVLKYAGFDLLSLANNHSFDFGEKEYLNTIRSCEKHNLFCNGHPYEVGNNATRILQVGEVSVGMIFLHGLTLDLKDLDFSDVLKQLREKTHEQIAVVHWGEEYTPLHNESQEEIAYFLIDNGIDAIFGHHPHVVQDVELYKGKPIFYSLGNFIFDQYFSDEVQQGLVVEMDISEKNIVYTLIPISSLETRSQPQIMTYDGRNTFLNNIIFTENGATSTGVSSSFSVLR